MIAQRRVVRAGGESPGAGGIDDDRIVPHVTLLQLVTVVSEYARSEAELLASVVYMVRRS